MGKTTSTKSLVASLDSGQRFPIILDSFRTLLDQSVRVFNVRVGEALLVRTTDEQLPTHPKHIASVRARMGTLLEAIFVTLWNEELKKETERWSITFNYVTEYPDLYLRDNSGKVHFRLETKTLHNEADEGAARFDTWTKLIHRNEDILVILGWKWREAVRDGVVLAWPEIVKSEALSAWALAQERDKRLKIVGGTFGPQGQPFVCSSRTGKMIPDPGNYGKLKRIVHHSRRGEELHVDVSRLLGLLTLLYP